MFKKFAQSALLLFLTFNSLAFASDPLQVETTINGQRYLCTPTDGNSDNALNCFNRAFAGPFSRDESIYLCTGANNTSPADCALEAFAGPLSKDEALSLCHSAYSKGPWLCFQQLNAGPFSKDEALQACTHPSATVKTAECILKASLGSFSRTEAMKFCWGQINKSLIENANYDEDNLMTVTRKNELSKLIERIRLKNNQ